MSPAVFATSDLINARKPCAYDSSWPSRRRSARRAQAEATEHDRMPGAQSRWSAGKDLSWEPLRIERVCEVKYDHMQGDRFRHAATFLRWRADKSPSDCRYDQLEVTAAYELEKVLGANSK